MLSSCEDDTKSLFKLLRVSQLYDIQFFSTEDPVYNDIVCP